MNLLPIVLCFGSFGIVITVFFVSFGIRFQFLDILQMDGDFGEKIRGRLTKFGRRCSFGKWLWDLWNWLDWLWRGFGGKGGLIGCVEQSCFAVGL